MFYGPKNMFDGPERRGGSASVTNGKRMAVAVGAVRGAGNEGGNEWWPTRYEV